MIMVILFGTAHILCVCIHTNCKCVTLLPQYDTVHCPLVVNLVPLPQSCLYPVHFRFSERPAFIKVRHTGLCHITKPQHSALSLMQKL